MDGGSSGRLWLYCVGLYRAPVETTDAMHCGIGGTAVHAVCFLLSRSLFTVRYRNLLDTGSFFYLSFLILHSVQVWCTIKTMNNEIQISHFFNHSGVCHSAGFLDVPALVQKMTDDSHSYPLMYYSARLKELV